MDLMSLVAGGTLGVADDAFKLYQQRRSEAFQEQFAKEGIRWRMADAEAAGLSPVYGAGLSGAVGSPIPIMSSSLGEMGQNISRAALAGATEEERAAAITRNKLVEAQIRREDAQTEAVNLANLMLIRQLQAQPAMPSLYESGGGRSGHTVVNEADQFRFPGLRGAVEMFAPKVASASGDSRAVMSGDNPGWQKVRLTDGTSVYLPYAGEGQTYLGNNPVTGGLLAAPQWLFQQLLRLGDWVSERGVRDRAAFKRWWNDKSVYDPNSSYWRSK